MHLSKDQALKRRHRRVRNKVKGTAQRPRLCIHKSSRHIYAQLVNDDAATTFLSVTTNTKANKAGGASFSNKDWAAKLGAEIAGLAKGKGIEAVVFDRGGYPYHGVIEAFAAAAREAGLKF